MSEYAPLPNKARFMAGEKEVGGKEAIFPIFTTISGEIVFLATGFFISNQGIFATAKHVVMNGDKPYENLQTIQFEEDNSYYLRNVESITVHTNADVAVGVLREMKHVKTQQRYFNKCMTLTSEIPDMKSFAGTFAYPQTRTKIEDGVQIVDAWTSWHFGHVEEHYPNGRDRVMLPGHCFRTSIEIPGGASGGPVSDEKGRIFGINSTGWNGTNDSFVSSILSLLDLTAKVTMPDGSQNPSIRTLKDLGLISFEK